MTDPNSSPQTVIGKKLDHSLVEMDASKLVWRPGVYALIFNEAGEILLLDNLHNGKHDFPGGGLEVWETIGEGLKREVWEETGLTISIGELVAVGDGFLMTPSGKHWHTLRVFYRATIMDGELRNPILEDEIGTNPHWVNPQTLQEHDLTMGWEVLQKVLAK